MNSLGALKLAVGRLDAAAYIDANVFANDERTQFISGAFVNCGALMGPRDEFTPGAAAVIEAGPVTVSLIALSDDNTGERLFYDMFGAVELAFGYGGESSAGHLRITRTIDGAGEDVSGEAIQDMGTVVGFDQQIGATVGIFGRSGERFTGAADAEIQSAWSLGFDLHGMIPGRPHDNIGFAYGEISIPGGEANETLVEVYYRAVFDEQMALSIHVQSLANAECDPDAPDMTAAGIRAQLTF